MNEFDLIARYFSRPVRTAPLGVGDDCAILAPTPGCELLVSKDLLVEHRHFFADVDPVALGHKTLAKSLHGEQRNPYIELQDSAFYLVGHSQPWPALKDGQGREQPRRAGVSSFGFGGVNAQRHANGHQAGQGAQPQHDGQAAECVLRQQQHIFRENS